MTEEEPKKRFKLNKGRMLKVLVQGHTLRQLDELEDYFQELERKFETDKKKISLRYEEATSKSKLDPEEEADLAEYFSEEFQIIEDTFLKTFRYSMIVTICSVIEVALNDLCRYIRHLKELPLSLEDLRDDGLRRAETYLTKVCAIYFSTTAHEWNEIIKLSLIRNCIVHAQGNVNDTKSPSKIQNIIESTRHISLKNDKHIILEREFIVTSILNSKKLLNEVYDKAFDTLN